jgi:[ribosomal protein S5]-alanine N-acetyltransferase
VCSLCARTPLRASAPNAKSEETAAIPGFNAVTHTLVLRRLTLRPVGRGDAAFLLGHWNDPEVRRFLFDGITVTADQISQTITDSMHGFATAGWGLWLIGRTRTHDRDAIGTVGLRPLDDLGLEVFYSITPAFWGNGYATEAASGIVDLALNRLGLEAVFAEVDEANAASAAVIKATGMTPFATVAGALGPMVRYRRTR